MRARSVRSLLFVALLTASVAVGCGGGGNAGPTPQQLERVLLESTDLGPEWIETSRGPFDRRDDEHPSIDPALWCPDATAESEVLANLAGERGADAELEIARPEALFIGVRQQLWSNDAATDYLASADGAVERCDGTTWTDDDGNSFASARLDWPVVGDQAVHWSVTTVDPMPSGDAVWRMTLSVVRFGDVVMVLQQADARRDDSAAAEDDVERRDLLRIAVDRYLATAD